MKTRITFLSACVMLTEKEVTPIDVDIDVTSMRSKPWRTNSPRIPKHDWKFDIEVEERIEDCSLLGLNQLIAVTFPDGAVLLTFGKGRIEAGKLTVTVTNQRNGYDGKPGTEFSAEYFKADDSFISGMTLVKRDDL